MHLSVILILIVLVAYFFGRAQQFVRDARAVMGTDRKDRKR
jgi:hypothetical protein